MKNMLQPPPPESYHLAQLHSVKAPEQLPIGCDSSGTGWAFPLFPSTISKKQKPCN